MDEPRARGGRAQGAGSREGGARGRGWLVSARSLRPLPRRNLCCRRSRDRPGRRRIVSGRGIRAEAGPPLPDAGCAPVGRRVGESRPASGTPGLALPPSSHRRRPSFDSARPPSRTPRRREEQAPGTCAVDVTVCREGPREAGRSRDTVMAFLVTRPQIQSPRDPCRAVWRCRALTYPL